jgi:hypothetical protein
MIIKSYNYNSLITDDDSKEACIIIRDSIQLMNSQWNNWEQIFEKTKDYKDQGPKLKYKTSSNLFDRSEHIWLKYRMTFFTSVCLYLGKDVSINSINSMTAWSFMTNKYSQPDRDKLWHHHNIHGTGLVGILYLNLPEIQKEASTEISLDYPNNTNTFYIGTNKHTWNILPNSIWHRSGINNSEEYRFILAADINYVD